MKAVRDRRLGWSVAVLVVVLVAGAVAAPGSDRPRTTPVGKVYFGNPRNFQCPAELEAAKIFRVIPEYQQLVRDKVEPSDPRYWSLMDKATNRFIRALVTVAKKYGYDLIGEKDFLRGHRLESKVEDITLVVLDEIQGKPRT
jgi:hypothetical protein